MLLHCFSAVISTPGSKLITQAEAIQHCQEHVGGEQAIGANAVRAAGGALHAERGDHLLQPPRFPRPLARNISRSEGAAASVWHRRIGGRERGRQAEEAASPCAQRAVRVRCCVLGQVGLALWID